MKLHNLITFVLTGVLCGAVSSVEAQYTEVWNGVVSEGSFRTNEEILTHFHKNRAAFDAVWSAVYADSNAAYGAYRIVEAAYLLGDPEFPDLLERADLLADEIAQRENLVITGVVLAHNGLVTALCNRGDFRQAAAVVDRARKRFAALPQERVGPNGLDGGASVLASFLGDFATIERLQLDQLAAAERQDEQMRRMIGGQMMVPSTTTFILPILAFAQAGNGKDAEARETLTRFEKQFAEDEVAWESVVELSPAGPDRDAGVASQKHIECVTLLFVCNGWLELNESERALAALDGATVRLQSAIPVYERQAGFPDRNDGSHTARNARSFMHHLPDTLREIRTRRATCLLQLGRHAEAAELLTQRIQERANDTYVHPETVLARRDLGWAQLMGGDAEGARNTALHHAKEQLDMTGRLLEFATHQQRLSYLQHADPFSLLANTGETVALVESIMRLKGIVLDSVLEERQLASSAVGGNASGVLAQLQATRQMLAEATFSGDNKAGTLRGEVEGLEQTLASLTRRETNFRTALKVDTNAVMGTLAEGDAIIEFIRFRQMTKPGNWEPYYGAVVLRAGQKPRWVVMGECDPINKAVGLLIERISGSHALPEDSEIELHLKSLYNLVFSPLEAALDGTDRLILSPDADLCRLSFAVLMDPEGRFAAERWELFYVSTARDLLRDSPNPPERGADMILLADPDFNVSNVINSEDTRDASTTYLAFDREALPSLTPLPGSRKEMEILQTMARAKGHGVVALTGIEATETALRAVSPGPAYLHLATHGFVLDPTQVVRSASRGRDTGFAGGSSGKASSGLAELVPITSIVDNPLQRSVLALAGSNATFLKWKTGKIPPAENDGVLTAEEVATMNLSHTWLAVLSACETAAGETLSGEGVLGMRRGFFLAGVDHLMMTFWPIADNETVQIMVDFYGLLGDRVHPARAIHQVQREALVTWREERGVTAAVFLAGPFALSTSGSLPHQ